MGPIGNRTEYEGYVRRQLQQNKQISGREAQRIPDGIDFTQIPSLRPETRQKLTAVRPVSLGQASRISGVTPADIAILHIWLRRNGTGGEPQIADTFSATPQRLS